MWKRSEVSRDRKSASIPDGCTFSVFFCFFFRFSTDTMDFSAFFCTQWKQNPGSCHCGDEAVAFGLVDH